MLSTFEYAMPDSATVGAYGSPSFRVDAVSVTQRDLGLYVIR